MSSFGQSFVANTSTKQTRVDVTRCVAKTSRYTGTMLLSFSAVSCPTLEAPSREPGSTLDKTSNCPYARRNGVYCFDKDVQPKERWVFRVERIVVIHTIVVV